MTLAVPRVVSRLVLLALTCVVPLPSALAQAPDERASAVLVAARAALGGTERLIAAKTFVATGRTRQVRGDNLVPIEFQISWQAPDKYVRRDEFPAQDNGPVTLGFNGNTIIGAPPGPARGRGAAPPGAPPPPSAAPQVRDEAARLLLALFADAVTVMPLTFTYVGLAEAPQGQADVLEAKGPSTVIARLFIDKGTHLPVMLTWAGGAAENRLFLADYRDVNGLKWPFRIRRSVGADAVEEMNFDGFRLNTKIDPRKFEVQR